MSLSRGAKNPAQPKSTSKGAKGRVGYIPAPPVSPGEVLRQYILSSDVTQESIAKAMRVSRFSINQIVNGKRAITADMALRLARVTSTTPDLWLNLQRDVDLYEARLKLGDQLQDLKILRPAKSEQELFVER